MKPFVLLSKKAFLLFLVISTCLSISSLAQSKKVTKGSVKVKKEEQYTSKSKKPKNIILLIGDGMGTSQIYASIIARADATAFQRFKHIGFSKTNSSDDFITDSAAGATAFSIGKKTYNGAIGVDANKQTQETILETAEKQGLSTGLVATSTITHATPASFIAHQPTRADEASIANDFLNTEVDVLIGGGLKHFNQRKDGKDLMKAFKEKGYTIASTVEELNAVKQGKVVSLLYNDAMPPYSFDSLNTTSGRYAKMIAAGEKPRGDLMAGLTQKAIDLLDDNKKGFFLMVEGSQIDWGGHAMNTTYIINEVVDFDKQINIALDYAQKEGNTLVIVTADHETGGFSISGGDVENKKVYGKFIWDEHTGVMVPVFAFGPGAEEFQGIYHNTEIYHKMMKLLSLPIPAQK